MYHHDPTPRDLTDALGDYIAIRDGHPPQDPDPIAMMLARRWHFGEVLARIAGSEWNPSYAVRTLTTSDVGEAVGLAAERVAGVAYGVQRQELARVIWDVPTKRIAAAGVPVVDSIDVDEIADGGAIPLALASISEATVAAPAHYAVRVLIGRSVVVNDDPGVIGHLMRTLAGNVARTEAKLAAAALEAATFETTSATGMDVSALGEALAALRDATTPAANTANLRGEYLVVPTALEAAALILNVSMGNRLTIIPSPWVTSSYLLASPTQAPVLGRPMPLGLNGLPSVTRAAAVDTDQYSGQVSHYDGLALTFEQYIGVSVVDTVGCVEIPAS